MLQSKVKQGEGDKKRDWGNVLLLTGVVREGLLDRTGEQQFWRTEPSGHLGEGMDEAERDGGQGSLWKTTSNAKTLRQEYVNQKFLVK